MSTVVRLEDYRKAKPTQKVQPAATTEVLDAEHYFCQRCDSDQFRLYATGAVHCSKCSALMSNVICGENHR